MKHKVKYSKDLLWIKPFVESASVFINLSKLSAVNGYKVRRECRTLQYGSNIKSNRKYKINILTHEYQRDIKKYKAITIDSLLNTLAHELAHVNEFDHGYKHFKLQCLILLRFSYIIKKLGIKDTSARINNLVLEDLTDV